MLAAALQLALLLAAPTLQLTAPPLAWPLPAPQGPQLRPGQQLLLLPPLPAGVPVGQLRAPVGAW